MDRTGKFSCKCGAVFTQFRTLSRHVRRTFYSYICCECSNKSYNCKDHRDRHYKTEHPELQPPDSKTNVYPLPQGSLSREQ